MALTAETAAGQPAGNDHVVRPCQAQPYKGPAFYAEDIAPVDVLKAVKAFKAAQVAEVAEARKNGIVVEAAKVVEAAEAAKVAQAKAYIVHVAEWAAAPHPPVPGSTAAVLQERLTRSVWMGFNDNGEPREVKMDSNGNPILFNKTSTALIGMTHFSKPILPTAVMVGYGYSTTPAPKQNLADLVALLNALAGAAGGGTAVCSGGRGGIGKRPIVCDGVQVGAGRAAAAEHQHDLHGYAACAAASGGGLADEFGFRAGTVGEPKAAESDTDESPGDAADFRGGVGCHHGAERG
jgi:hypothetical protein